MIQNVWDTAKAVLRDKFISIQLTSETRKFSNKNLALHLKQLETVQTKPKVNRKLS